MIELANAVTQLANTVTELANAVIAFAEGMSRAPEVSDEGAGGRGAKEG